VNGVRRERASNSAATRSASGTQEFFWDHDEALEAAGLRE
jgi:hypothetical protein